MRSYFSDPSVVQAPREYKLAFIAWTYMFLYTLYCSFLFCIKSHGIFRLVFVFKINYRST